MPDVHPTVVCPDHPADVVDRYRLGPVLRRSPGCCVHRAVDRLLRRTVAVTLVEGDGLELAEQSWRGRSPEVAEVFDGGTWHGRLFLVTQHPGATLAETTPPSGLTIAEARDLGLAVATVLAPLHRHGRCHGGLGPGTVAWSARGAVLSDVGLLPWLARWSDVRLDPPYPAPGPAATPAADVYALGRLLSEVLPRRVPAALRTLLADMTSPVAAARPDLDAVTERLLRLPSRRRVAAAAGDRGRRALVAAAASLLLATGVGVGALVNASGAGSSTAYAADAGSTVVPGVPLPPVAALVVPPDEEVADEADEVDETAADPVPRVTPRAATASPRPASRASVRTRSSEPSPKERDRPERRSAREAPERDRPEPRSDDRDRRPAHDDRSRDSRHDRDRDDDGGHGRGRGDRSA